MRRIVRCVAEGRGDEWEAICLDLDIAVQGQSFEDVFASLNKAIVLHIEAALDLPEADRRRLLHRPVPLSVKLGVFWPALRLLFTGPGRKNAESPLRHTYTYAAAT